MLEILIDNRNGNVWDISSIVTKVTWKTSRIGKAGSLEFTLIKGGLYQSKDFQWNNGDVVRVKKGDKEVFYGYIFTIEETHEETVRVQCYDQIRYLMAQDTYVFSNVTAAEVLRQIAEDFQLPLGRVDESSYRIPKMVEDNKKLLDIICNALQLTLIYGNENYFLFDDFGKLSLRKSSDFLFDCYIGDGSLLTGFNAKRSIDSDTYNLIKLFKDNKETGKREIFQVKDSANIAKWGTLQLYQSVNENWNDAQINEYLNNLIFLKNRETRTLSLSALGDIQVRAGGYIIVVLQEYGINQPFLIEECTHNFEGLEHTMDLELKVVLRQ